MAKRRVSLKTIEASIKSPNTPGPMKAGLIRKYGKQLGLTKAQIAKYTKASGAMKNPVSKMYGFLIYPHASTKYTAIGQIVIDVKRLSSKGIRAEMDKLGLTGWPENVGPTAKEEWVVYDDADRAMYKLVGFKVRKSDKTMLFNGMKKTAKKVAKKKNPSWADELLRKDRQKEYRAALQLTAEGVTGFQRERWSDVAVKFGMLLGYTDAKMRKDLRDVGVSSDEIKKVITHNRKKGAGKYAKMTSFPAMTEGLPRRKNPSRKRSNPSLTSDEMYELQELYHTARAAGMNTKYERMKWAAAEFHKVHPDIPAVRAYKALSAEVGFLYRNPRDKGRGKYKRTRLESPKHFDPRSFRTKTVKKGAKVIIGCPEGKYAPRKGACKVGTRAQALLKAKGNPKEVGVIKTLIKKKLSELSSLINEVEKKQSSMSAESLSQYVEMLHGKFMYVDGLRDSLTRDDLEGMEARAFGRKKIELQKRFLELQRVAYGGKKNPPRSSATPAGGVVIYDELQAIEAKKGNYSLWPKENFRHDFKGASKAKVIGMPDGSLVIKGKKRLWNNFQYSEEDGTRGKRRNPVKKGWTGKSYFYVSYKNMGKSEKSPLRLGTYAEAQKAADFLKLQGAKGVRIIRKNPCKTSHYIGVKRNKGQFFTSKNPPTKSSHGHRFTKVYGPFTSKQKAAEYAETTLGAK